MRGRLDNLIAETQTITANVERAFGGLTAEQLNWKPSVKSWSVGQCLEHLIVTNELEFPAIEDAFRDDYKNPFWSRAPFLPKLFGNLLVRMVNPENARKFKAPKSFRPSQSAISAEIVKDFATHQQKVIGFFERSGRLNLDETKIVSPISDFVTYSLFDSYYALVIHEKRHFLQAERVILNAGFPK